MFPGRGGPRKACTGKPTVIAVIDTGYGVKLSQAELDAHLCKFGHKDYTNGPTTDEYDTKVPVPLDTHGHGTHIAGIIDAFARRGNINYCLVILKYYDKEATGEDNLKATINAIKHATALHADFINYSGGGILTSQEEKVAVKNYIDQGGIFVAAAGNEGVNIDYFHFYPAQDDPRVIVVGMGESAEKKDPMSDYGKRVNRWEPGRNIRVYDMYMSGTSQSTAVATGKLVYQTHNFCK